MAKQFLNNAYGLASSNHTKRLYKDWAETYDEEIMANGYSSPVRTAEALAKCGAGFGCRLWHRRLGFVLARCRVRRYTRLGFFT